MKSILTISVISIILLGAGYYLLVKKSTPVSSALPTTQKNGNPMETIKGEPLSIIAFGDSLTAGYGELLENSYPSLLEKELLKQGFNVKLINMGVSGETTSAGLDRVDFVLSQNPSIVLLGLGANDMLRASSPEIARKNLRTIIQSLQQRGVSVVLLGMKSTASNGTAYRGEFDALYPTLAKEYGIPLVPFFLDGVALNASLNTNDGIHPNKAGYEKIIQTNILPILLPVLKSKGL